jgi:hypothetical protein
MKRKTVLNPILILGLILALAASLASPAVVMAQGNVPPCYTLNARDFTGIITTSSPEDFKQGFSWFGDGGEVETYAEAYAVRTQVSDPDNYPQVSTQANVPANTYRAWINQGDADGDRSLETKVGTDAPVHTGVDNGSRAWHDLGIHQVGLDTVISVKAVGALQYHGQPNPDRRGGFWSIYLSTDTTTQTPAFTPDGQTSCSPAGSVEFSDNFESYPLGSKLANVYEYAGIMAWGVPGPAPQADLFQVGTIGSNQVFKYDWAGPSYHYPQVREFYRQKFSQISEAGANYLYTQPSMGIELFMFEWDGQSDSIYLEASYENKVGVYDGSTGLVGTIDLWPDKVITQMSHRLQVKRLSDTSLEVSVTRLDTSEKKTLTVVVPRHESSDGYRAGFAFYEDYGGGVHVNIDDFYVKGTPLTTSTNLAATFTGTDIYPGDPISVDLNIQNASNLYAAQADCATDAAIIRPQDAAFGSFFDPVNRLVGANTADAEAGTWTGAISQRSPALPLSGDGLFASVNYRAQDPGSASVDCEVVISDQDGFTQPVTFTGTSVTVLPFATVNGVAKYQGRTDYAGITVSGPIPPDAITDSDGNFTLEMKTGTSLSVTASAPGYLSNGTSVDATSGETTTLPATTLRGGDVNNDGVINIADATLVAANFGKNVPPGDARADINADDKVNIQDLAILGSNYGLSGLQPW